MNGRLFMLLLERQELMDGSIEVKDLKLELLGEVGYMYNVPINMPSFMYTCTLAWAFRISNFIRNAVALWQVCYTVWYLILIKFLGDGTCNNFMTQDFSQVVLTNKVLVHSCVAFKGHSVCEKWHFLYVQCQI